jgi:hypothetical protein
LANIEASHGDGMLCFWFGVLPGLTQEKVE